jgi:hypothetical protein
MNESDGAAGMSRPFDGSVLPLVDSDFVSGCWPKRPNQSVPTCVRVCA